MTNPLSDYIGEIPNQISQLLIDNQNNINAINQDGDTILNIAIKLGDNPLALFLINEGAKLNLKNKNNETALSLSAKLDNQELVKRLILEGADPDEKNNQNKSPADLKPEYFNSDFILKLVDESLAKEDSKSITNIIKHHRHLLKILLEKSTENPKILTYINNIRLPRRKINQRELNELIYLYRDERNFRLKDYIRSLNYIKSLKNLEIDGSLIKQADIIDFSDLSLKSTRITKLKAKEKILFNNANLEQANISFKIPDSTIVDFTKANLEYSFISGVKIQQGIFDETAIKQTMIMGSANAPEGYLTQNQSLHTIDLVVDSKSSFNQNIMTFNSQLFDNRGICNGLCFELARYTLMSLEKGEGYGNFIEKLNRKITNPSTNFIFRVQSYQANLQMPVENLLEIDHKYIINNNFLSKLEEYNDPPSDIIGCGVSSSDTMGHAFTLTRIRNENNDIIGYKIFDPNFGEIECPDEQTTNQKINLIYQLYQQNVSKQKSFFKIFPLDKLVKNLGITHPHDNQLSPETKLQNKENKYSALSAEKYFYKHILNNKASPEQEQIVNNSIQRITLEQINQLITLPNDRNTNLLMLAIEFKKNQLVEQLIDKGANIEYVNEQGISPLSTAIISDNETAVKLLLKRGVNPNINTCNNFHLEKRREHFCGDEVIAELFKEAILSEDKNTINNLLRFNKKFKAQKIDEEGNTLLSFALKEKKDISSYLIKRGFRINKLQYEEFIAEENTNNNNNIPIKGRKKLRNINIL